MNMKKNKEQKLPRCIKCKYSYPKFVKSDYKKQIVCLLSDKDGEHKTIPSVYVPSLKTYEYIRPDWCPLKEEKSNER